MASIAHNQAGPEHYETPDSARAIVRLKGRAQLRANVYRHPNSASLTFDDLATGAEWSLTLSHEELRELHAGLAFVLSHTEA
jgi:hypothetical protein